MPNKLFKQPKLYDAGGDIDKRWYVHYSFLHPETGKYKRFKHFLSSRTLTKRERYRQANELINQIKEKLEEGYNPFIADARKITLQEGVEKFIALNSANWRKRTSTTYSSIASIFKQYLYKKKLLQLPIEQFTTNMARDFMDYIQINRRPAQRTYNNYLTVVSRMFYFFVEREYCKFNPIRKLPKKKIEHARIIAFNDDELKIIREDLREDDPRLYLISQIIYYCFLRPQEIVRLQKHNFHIAAQYIEIYGDQSKNRQQTTVTIPNSLQEILLEEDWDFPDSYYVFSHDLEPGKREIGIQRINERFRQWANMAGLNSQKKIYHLKHTGVGKAIEAGINIRDIQLQLRHSSLEATQVYIEKFNHRPSSNLKNKFI